MNRREMLASALLAPAGAALGAQGTIAHHQGPDSGRARLWCVFEGGPPFQQGWTETADLSRAIVRYGFAIHSREWGTHQRALVTAWKDTTRAEAEAFERAIVTDQAGHLPEELRQVTRLWIEFAAP